jgi:hypothetical protein
MDKPIGPFPYAITAFALAALLEYPLGKRYPLAKPIRLSTRMAVAGGLAFVSTYAAYYIVSAFKRRPQLP